MYIYAFKSLYRRGSIKKPLFITSGTLVQNNGIFNAGNEYKVLARVDKLVHSVFIYGTVHWGL